MAAFHDLNDCKKGVTSSGLDPEPPVAGLQSRRSRAYIRRCLALAMGSKPTSTVFPKPRLPPRGLPR